MRRVLVTHADQPLGRRLVKALYHDPGVERVLAVGSGAVPRAFDRLLADGDRTGYLRVDLARHRPVSDLFHAERLRRMEIDSVVHVPSHGAGTDACGPVIAGLPVRTAEARLVLQHCREVARIRHVIALGSAFVYRRPAGNANRLRETSELDLDPSVPDEFRAWIDCDMLFRAEVASERLRVVLLRLPTVVASGGAVYLNPSLEGGSRPRLRPLGFDPLCALISDKDVAKGVQAALHSTARGVFNLAGRETLPLSVLSRWTRRPTLPVPGGLLGAMARAAGFVAGETARVRLDGDHLRFGFTLDTRRAERELGFEPHYRVGMSRAGDGSLRLETSPA